MTLPGTGETTWTSESPTGDWGVSPGRPPLMPVGPFRDAVLRLREADVLAEQEARRAYASLTQLWSRRKAALASAQLALRVLADVGWPCFDAWEWGRRRWKGRLLISWSRPGVEVRLVIVEVGAIFSVYEGESIRVGWTRPTYYERVLAPEHLKAVAAPWTSRLDPQ